MKIKKIFQTVVLSFLAFTALLAYAQTDSDINNITSEVTQNDY